MKSNSFFIMLIITLISTSCMTTSNLSYSQVNERRVQYKTKGVAEPTIVFETGMGQTIQTWNPILDSLSTHTSTFAYNRPGYGSSSLHDPPKHVEEVAQQLHENLLTAKQKPPYLLVGHSAGGLYVNMFARMYPDEVIGIVFLDASHPDQFEYFKNHQGLLYSLLITATTTGNRRYEHALVKNTQSDFEYAPSFPRVPVTVLTAGKKSSFLENKAMREKWLIFQDDLANLSDLSKHLVVQNSGHYIHKDNPDLVIQEILDLIQTFKTKEIN